MSTGQAIGGVVGAVAGFFVAGPAGAFKGAMYGMSIGGMLMPEKGPDINGPRLNDLSQQLATYGAVIPRVYGSIALAGNIFWIENNAIKETSKTKKVGGKGGGGGQKSTTYSYSATFAVGLCEGPIAGVRRIWAAGTLIYDAGSGDLGTVLATTAVSVTIHNGEEAQLPDPRMQAALGVANTPAFRGLSYIVFNDFALEKYGNTLMGVQIKVEVVKAVSYSHLMHTGVSFSYTPSHGLFAVTANSAFVLIGAAIGTYYRSVDGGVSFKVMSFGVSLVVERFCSSDDGRVHVAFLRTGTTLKVLYSENGVGWSDAGNLTGYIPDFFEVVYARDRFVLISMYSASVWYSSDGLSWSESADELPYSEWHGLAYSPDLDRLCVVTYSHSCIIASKQRSAAAWSVISPPWVGLAAFPVNWTVAWGGGEFLVSTNITSSALWASSDGITWSARSALTSPEFNDALAYGNGVWISIPPAPDFPVMYSIDSGATWVSSGLFPQGADVCWNGAWFCYGGKTRGGYIRIRTPADSGATLSSVVGAECLKSNLLKPGDIDTTSLIDLVRGYRVASVAALRSGLDPLQGAWPFDVIQAGYKIKFKRRGAVASVATIDESLLDARTASENPGVRITKSREMDTQLPWRVNITHLDISREYDIGEQYAERLNTDSINVQTIEMPVVLTATEAAKKAETLLYMYWLERYDISFKLPPPYGYLEPGDVITVTTSAATYQLRLLAINYTSGGFLECSAKLNDNAVYTSAAIGAEGWTPSPVIPVKGPSAYELLDIPLMKDIYNVPGFPVAMGGYLAGWSGGSIFRSTDGGQTWDVTNPFSGESTIGEASSVLAAPDDSRMIDKRNILAVNLYSGALFSVTESQMLNGANHFALGVNGRWEIIAAQNCTLQVDGSYLLSDLLRGRFGTEWAMGLHVAGDQLVLVDETSLQFSLQSLNQIGVPALYRGITSGDNLETGSSLSFTYTGVNLECLSPVWLNGARSAANDWALTWIRRTRVGGELRDYVDATLGEASESYEVEIFSSNTYATLKRTITGLATAAATYTSAQQVTDFGSNQSTLYVKIYQLSQSVGRGYPLITSITR